MLEAKKLFYIVRRNLFGKLLNILFEFWFKRGSQKKVSENIQIFSGRISGKVPGKIREKISDDLVWTLLKYNLSFDVFQKSPAWFGFKNCSVLYKVLLLMFEYSYDACYDLSIFNIWFKQKLLFL